MNDILLFPLPILWSWCMYMYLFISNLHALFLHYRVLEAILQLELLYRFCAKIHAYQVAKDWCKGCLCERSDSNNDTSCKHGCSFEIRLYMHNWSLCLWNKHAATWINTEFKCQYWAFQYNKDTLAPTEDYILWFILGSLVRPN